MVTDRNSFRPIRSALLLMNEIKRQQPDQFQWRGPNQREPRMYTLDRLAGTDELRKSIDAGTLPALLKRWDAQDAEFERLRRPYLLYR